jgi:pyruvate,water dikinase
MKITVPDLKNLSHEDAINLISKGIKYNYKRAQEYLRHTIFISLTGKVKERYEGVLADKYEKLFLITNKNTSGEFKGRSACRGLVRGFARIIHSPKDFSKIKKGDIIIVMNTGPDFVPILNRVGAIVSEEGGITAHVSVISRELNIPCVVGIPKITKELKDDDSLEVDANKGIVKILKKL